MRCYKCDLCKKEIDWKELKTAKVWGFGRKFDMEICEECYKKVFSPYFEQWKKEDETAKQKAEERKKRQEEKEKKTAEAAK